MYTYHYIIDGREHTIRSKYELANSNGTITISQEQHAICRTLKQLLTEWKRIAKQYDIKWFLNGGSLLGALRDRGLIFYDNDTDLVCTFNDYYKIKSVKTELLLVESECGFRLSFKHKPFPFIDIWLIHDDPKDATKMCACAPIYYGKPMYYYTDVWKNEWYYKKDLKNLEKAKFEGISCYIPKNATQIVKRMYGESCLEEYRYEAHTEEHEGGAKHFPTEVRVQMARFFKNLNVMFGLDSGNNPDSHLSSLITKNLAELTVSSSKNKHLRVIEYTANYVAANIVKNIA
jgi:hypothetical protein